MLGGCRRISSKLPISMAFQRIVAGERLDSKVNPGFQHLLTIKFCSNHRSAGINCWKCAKIHSSQLFCPFCNSIQNVNDVNYFRLLDTEQTFDVDLTSLKQYYIKLQVLLHPDKFATASKTEQEYSESYSTFVNEAFKTLSNPIQRGLYILELNGHTLDSETVEDDANNILNEIFVLNFEVDESEDASELNDLLSGLEEDITRDLNSASNAFNCNNFLLAKEAMVRLKYRYNIKEKIQEKLLNLSL